MFFHDRITGIRPGDRVLEIGPGGTPHPRSDVLLERNFDSASEAEEQRGYAPALATDRQVVFYDGGRFPFVDQEFDYVICSHVLEHVADVEFFVGELTRVAGRGYLEFPTIYYDYIYDIPKHITMLMYRPELNTIYYMPKVETGLDYAAEIQRFFFATTFKGYVSLIGDLKDYLFQGFEWSGQLSARPATCLRELLYDVDALDIPEFRPPPPPAAPLSLVQRVRNRLRRLAMGGAQ